MMMRLYSDINFAAYSRTRRTCVVSCDSAAEGPPILSSTLDSEAVIKYAAADGSTTQCAIHVVQGARVAGVGWPVGHL